MIDLKRQTRRSIKWCLRKGFEVVQHLGFDVLPRHFYSEIPCIYRLRKEADWRIPYSLSGVRGADVESQVRFLEQCCPQSMTKNLARHDIHGWACRRNGEEGFGPVEAAFLYAFVSNQKPGEIFQIGCGVSTAICLLAAEDAGYTPKVTCVDPYPTKYLTEAAARDRITLIRNKAQSLNLEMIEGLGSDVLFFVDSTHTLGPAGEVTRVILEMLPLLEKGAWVHFHDITFPYDYDRRILTSALFFRHESALLHAFLAFNPNFRIAVSLSMLHYGAPEVLGRCLPNYQPEPNEEGLARGIGHFPSSTYLQVEGRSQRGGDLG